MLKFPYDLSLSTPELKVFFKIETDGGVFAYVNEKLAYYYVHKQPATYSGLAMQKLLKKIIDIIVPLEYESAKAKMILPNIIP